MVKFNDIAPRRLNESMYLTEDALPKITSQGVSKFIRLPAVWPILKRAMSKAIPVAGTGLSLYDAWNEALKGDWTDSLINLGLAGLSIGQLAGYVAGGAPGVAATTASIAGSLYVIRGVLVRLYFEQVEGTDLSNYSDEDLEDYTDELIAELAKQLADMITSGIYDAVTGASEEAASMTSSEPEYDAMGNVIGTVTTTPVSPTSGESLPPLPKVPEKPEAPKLPASVIKSKANDTTTTVPTNTQPTVTKASATPPQTRQQAEPAVQRSVVSTPSQGLNFKDIPFGKAWQEARALAKKLDPENPGAYNFIWNGKPYQTNAKGEPTLPISKQRKLIDLSGGTLAEDTIGNVLKWFGRSADDAANVAGDVAGAADNVGTALKAGQTAEDAENIAKELDVAVKAGNQVIAGILNDATNIVTLNGTKYAKYYDPMRDTWKWVDLQKAEAGGKRSMGFVDDATTKQLDDALTSAKPATAADDAAKAADDAATATPSSTTPKAITLTDEARALLRSKPVEQWTVAELKSLGYTADDVNILSIAQKLGDDIAKTPDEIIKTPFWKNWSRSTGVSATVTSKLPTKGQVAWAFLIYGGPVFDAAYKTWNLDPNDPNYNRRLTEIWTTCAAEVGLLVAGSYMGAAAASKLLNNKFIKVGGKWPWVNTVAKAIGAGGGYYAASEWAVPSVEALVNKISDTVAGEIPRDRERDQGGTGSGGALQTGETPTHSSDSLFDRAYRHAKSIGASDAAAARTAALTVKQGPNSSWAKDLENYNESMTNVFALAWLHKLLNENTNPVDTVKIHKRIKHVLERFNNKKHAETIALQLVESKVLNEEQTDNFMSNITAAIAANTKGDKTGAQKALDAAKQSQPATAQDQINQKKVLDQMARTNPGLKIPNTNQNVTEDDPMGSGNDWAATANTTNSASADLLAAYNEFAAQYPAAKFLLDIVPVTGAATSVIDATQHFSNGQYSQAALDILGAIPGFKIAKYLSRGLANVVKTVNTASKTANYANATSDYAANAEMYESISVGDRIMLELADGRVIVAPIAELRGNSVVLELDETGNQWLDESPEHSALKIGNNDGHPLSTTAEMWNAMVDQLPSDTPDGWAEVFINMQNQTGQPARIMPRLWAQIWRQQHNELGDSLTRIDMSNWAEEVGKALDNSGLLESSLNPSNSIKLKKYLDPKDPAMLAVWMASRAGTRGIPVSKFAKDKALQSGLPADHWWRRIKKLVQEGAVPTVPRLLAARDIEPLVHFEGDYYIVSHNDGKHLKYDLVKKVVATTDRNRPAYQHVDHLDTGLHRITKEQLRRLASVAMEADKLADGEDDTPDLPDLLGVIAQVMGRKVRKHPDALSTSVKKSDMGYVVSNLIVRHLDGTEAQDLKNALHRAGYNVSKVIINPTTILVILKTTKTKPNTVSMITATPQPDVVGGLAETRNSSKLPKDEIAEARRDFNFDEDDIAKISAMDDLDAAKKLAIKLITAKTRRPMTKEKIMWFTNSINDTKSINRLVKMLFDMMLSGEGHGVIGDRFSTAKSSYRRQFDEESQRLDPKCWKGYRKQGTKVKDGVRVNNCVKVNENDMDEEEEELYYDAINHMDNLYHSLTDKKWTSAATYLSELGMLYQEAGVYLPDAIDMITDRRTKMHIERIYGLLDSNKDDVIRGILTMIKTGHESVTSVSNLISVLDEFGAEWPELDAIEAAVAKSLPNSISEAIILPHDIVTDPFSVEQMDKAKVIKFLNNKMNTMDQRQRIAIKMWMDGYTFDEIAKEFGGISSSRARQILAKGLRVLRHHIQTWGKEFKYMDSPKISDDEYKTQVKRNWNRFTDSEKTAINSVVNIVKGQNPSEFDKTSFDSAWKKMFKTAPPPPTKSLKYGSFNSPSRDIITWQDEDNIKEAEYNGKSVPLNKPIRTSPSEGGKFKVYVKDPKTGNIKMVRFGDTTGLSIKRDDPKRRKSFRARHNCDNPGPKTKARYWSCKMWTRKPVGKILKGK